MQARVGEGGKLLEVKTETVVRPAPTSDNPRVREALAAVEAARQKLLDAERRVQNNLAAQKTIDSIAAKAASDATQAMGASLDPEKLRGQLAFIEAERERLTAAALAMKIEVRDAAGAVAAAEAALNAAGGAPPIERFALVTMVAPQAADVPVSVTYLVANASWAPTYVVRGDPDAGTPSLEFDANIVQATGEDWSEVALTLSTSRPTRAANPREIPPAYVDILQPVEEADMPKAVPGAAARMDTDMRPRAMASEGGEAMARGKRLAEMASDASVGGTGPAIEFVLPRTFTAASDQQAERRTRVATIEARPSYALVARPLVDSDVYLRARFRNETSYLLLAGAAHMYLGADSIGQASLAATAPGGEIELWFGREPRVTVKRELVAKTAGESGVFTKSKAVDRAYRISLVNTLPRAVDVEVWDRVPVSRNKDVEITMSEVAPALATDEKFVRDSRPQGLLKWVLSLPARADGKDARPTAISWKTRTVWPQDQSIAGDAD
ncbi:MAG: DUF4139 domain-containing protein [Planctomycetota bacterium]